jgi:hypothetical protein
MPTAASRVVGVVVVVVAAGAVMTKLLRTARTPIRCRQKHSTTKIVTMPPAMLRQKNRRSAVNPRVMPRLQP